MSNYRLPSSSPHAIHSGRLGSVSGNSGSGGVPLGGVPFVIRLNVDDGTDVRTFVPAGGLQHDFRVIDAWMLINTVQAGGTLDIQLTAGAGDDAFAIFTTATAGRVASNDAAGDITRTSIAVTANATNGLFVDHVGGTAARGEVFLLCVRD